MKDKQSYSISLTAETLRILQEAEPTFDGRFDKFKAFGWLVDAAAQTTSPQTVNFRGQEVLLAKGQLATSFSELGETWNWHRNNVRLFLCALEEQHALTMERRGKATVITFPLLFEGETSPVKLPTPEEMTRLRFVLGIAVWNELAGLFDGALTGWEDEIHDMIERDDAVGDRLQMLLNHLMLRFCRAFPKSDAVSDALHDLFMSECNCDLESLFSLLSVGGMEVMEGTDVDEQPPISISEYARERIAVVLDYYSPLLVQENNDSENDGGETAETSDTSNNGNDSASPTEGQPPAVQ